VIPELGQLALILALGVAIIQGLVPLLGAQIGIQSWVAVAKPVARVQLGFVLIAFGCLLYSFLVHDFSVAYVAKNSNTQLPTMYLVSAVWGAHEGSLLLWATVLSLWTGLVTIFSRSIPSVMVARVIGVLGLVNVGFLLFMIMTSNPFERLAVPPVEGNDLNPLLQDPGLAIHPPMLYLGYVGFAVPFALALAAMLGGRFDSAWARWSRPWAHMAWVCLTLGIALGSWWAYYELGWGGWWFWDPVENASFMPWLVGTALIHSLAVSEKRGAFKAWSILLAIFTFSLSLLGTFLVRSGVLTSVHAFASDPSRGVFILIFLVLVVGSSLLLYTLKAVNIRSRIHFGLVSRETALLLNNVFLVVAATAVLLGTLYPLILDALDKGKISVGPPYFSSVFVPITLPMLAVMGLGMFARWKQDQLSDLWVKLRLPLVISVVIGLAFPALLMSHFTWQAALGLILATWVFITTMKSLYGLSRGRGLLRVSASNWGMVLGHVGIAVFVVGVTLTSIYSTEKDLQLEPDGRYQLGGYEFVFRGVKDHQGDNYQASRGRIDVYRDDTHIAVLEPEKRIYTVQRQPMTEAAIDAGLTRDLFVALGEPLGDQGSWSLRIYHKPFIRWIWLGALIMAMGGIVSACDRRYRVLARRSYRKEAGSAEALA
jgi:cytochrome c-type biogenesis protein CcmF